jgi:hypothetical protein
MARLDRFKSVFDEFQDGFDRGFDRQVKLAALIQQARAQYAQEERARANTNLDISRFNLAQPVAAAKAARDLYFLQQVAPQLDANAIQERLAISSANSRNAQLQEALSRQDFDTAQKLTGKQWRFYNGRIESSADGQNWFAGNTASDIVDQGMQLTRAGQNESLRQLANAANPPAPAGSNPSSSVFTQPAAAPSPADIAFPLTGRTARDRVAGASFVSPEQRRQDELLNLGFIPPASNLTNEESPYGDFMGKGRRPQISDDQNGVRAQIEALKAQLALQPDPFQRSQLRQQILALQQQLGV